MKHLLEVFASAFVALSAFAAESSVSFSGPSTIVRFEQPSRLVNQGTKFTVGQIVNPMTGQWELVWGDKPWSESWIKGYLRFDGLSDDVHHGGSLTVLKPVTLAISVFGNGQTSAQSSATPASLTVVAKPPSPGENFIPSSQR